MFVDLLIADLMLEFKWKKNFTLYQTQQIKQNALKLRKSIQNKISKPISHFVMNSCFGLRCILQESTVISICPHGNDPVIHAVTALPPINKQAAVWWIPSWHLGPFRRSTWPLSITADYNIASSEACFNLIRDWLRQ